MKKFNIWDLVIVLSVCLIALFFYTNLNTRAENTDTNVIKITGKAGNLEKEVANSIATGDIIMDKNGTQYFEIQYTHQRPSSQAVPNWENEVIAVDSPELDTVEFTAVSINPRLRADNLFYNWQQINPGMKVYIETNKTGFFAIITKIESIPKEKVLKVEE